MRRNGSDSISSKGFYYIDGSDPAAQVMRLASGSVRSTIDQREAGAVGLLWLICDLGYVLFFYHLIQHLDGPASACDYVSSCSCRLAVSCLALSLDGSEALDPFLIVGASIRRLSLIVCSVE